ncbi:hypothetical protein GOB87_12610 [Acetobacter estunensis]|uniref:Replication protein C n=1 Tax=Acetobacter estunensis TaxID=104097 RepID=A0A967EE79_9PROT|nr:plasmid replication protein RepC [Acetobacter estunensis]NHO54775.1 hypothetical protein [Acetobacter estunensis]
MNQRITERPSGARRITPAMVLAQRAAEMQTMSDASPKDILSVLRRARSAVGLTCQQTELLAFLVSWTRPQDWGEDGLPICAARNADIMERFDLGRTRVKELIRSLAEAGWLICNDSPNGHRFVRRAGRTGPVTHGYGFDLSPLSRRFAELEQAALAQEERRREGRRLHGDVMGLARKALALCAAGEEAGVPRVRLETYEREARELLALRGRDRDIAILTPLAERLAGLVGRIETDILAVIPVESDPMGSPERPPITTTNPDHSAKATVSGSGYAAKAHEASRSENEPQHVTPTSPLRGFRATPSFLLQIAPGLRDLCPSSRPSEREIMEAVPFLCHSLGISTHAWRQAINVLGPYEAAVALCVIAARHGRGEVRSPGGMLRAMIARHIEGTLALDRSLYGLAEHLDTSKAVH